MSVWAEIVSAGVGAGWELAKEAKLWKTLLATLRRRKTLLVLGAGGTGKTQFINSVLDPSAARVHASERTVSTHIRRKVLDVIPFRLIDTPGHRLDEAKRKIPIQSAVQKGIEGIINVVSYGYHEAAEAGAAHAVPERGSAVARPVFLRERRRVETGLLSEWVPFLDASTVGWILTVVTKADLWWPDENDRIVNYYTEGTYAKHLKHLRPLHSVVPYCSIIGPFYGGRTGGRFGDDDRNLLRRNLLFSIHQLTSKKW